jgi:hypothetical protein
VPPGAKWDMWIFVPPGAEWDIGEICAARGRMGICGYLCRQGPKWDIGEICAARGRMGICGYLCRQGPNYLETYDPEGVKEDFGRNCAARGQRVNSTLKGSHVYRIYAARGLMGICGYLCRQGPKGKSTLKGPNVYKKGRLSF